MTRLLAFTIPLLLLFGLSLVTGYRPFYFLLYFVLVLLAFSYLWTWLQTRGLEVRVESLSTRPQVGHALNLRITVREKLGIPRLALKFKLLAGPVREEGLLLNIRPRASSQWMVSSHHHRRGINVIGSLLVTATDPLGLATLSRQVGDPHTITAHPRVIPLSWGISTSAAAPGDTGGTNLIHGSSASAFRVREHQPSDSLNRIHWPSTAKANRLMSKEFDSGGHTEVWLFLDLQGSEQSGSGLESTEEYGVTIAASLAKSLVESGQRVGVAAQGDKLLNISPNRDIDHLWNILTSLALIKAQGSVPLPTLMVKESLSIPHGSLAVVIAPGPMRSGTTIFQFMYRRGVTVVPVLLESGSFQDEPVGKRTSVLGEGHVIRRGDHLPHTLANVMDRLVY